MSDVITGGIALAAVGACAIVAGIAMGVGRLPNLFHQELQLRLLVPWDVLFLLDYRQPPLKP